VTRGIPWIVGGLLISAAIVLWGSGSIEAATALFAAAGLIVVAGIGRWMSTPMDRRWLPLVVSLAYLVKLAASATRWAVLEFVYNGSGDATGYHGAGRTLVAVWRSVEAPEIAIGTKFVDAATAFLYIPYVPSLLGGFFLFATLAFMGQILMYAAFRMSADVTRLGWYAAAIFFLPTIVYWPSSIGKESLMFLFLGIGVYGAAALLRDYRLRWVAIFGLGVAGCAIIRPHVAFLFVVALAIALLLGKGRTGNGLMGRRVIAIIAISLVFAAAASVVASKFGVDFGSGLEAAADLETVLENVEGNTTTGGSQVAGSAIRSPLEFPSGMLKVLFRPFPQEANTPLSLLSSLEGMVLLGLFVWRIPVLIRNGWHIRRDPYLVFALAFVIGFVIAFSAFNNFGLLARQRSQVMPFVMALLIGLGWSTVTPSASSGDNVERPIVQRSHS
jgi:hypothetical protein